MKQIDLKTAKKYYGLARTVQKMLEALEQSIEEYNKGNEYKTKVNKF